MKKIHDWASAMVLLAVLLLVVMNATFSYVGVYIQYGCAVVIVVGIFMAYLTRERE